jgi:formylglycine-generating enzyme required for sulfatase activity
VFCSNSEQPEHNVTVSTFALDTFEVTVGRFRRFVDTYNGTPPPEGAGQHPLIPGTGWQSAWNVNLGRSKAWLNAELSFCSGTSHGVGDHSWTDIPGSHENAPITCVSWYMAFAFCIWDDGRLPTEAEWEYAAAGGTENRLYPWGSAPPDASRIASSGAPWAAVGSTPMGNGRWGHRDLAGDVAEWVFDRINDRWYSSGGATCVDCANSTGPLHARVFRGGGWLDFDGNVRSAGRSYEDPATATVLSGFRCARSL